MDNLKYTRIESLECFSRSERLQMTLNLNGGGLTVSYQGRDAKEIEINTALWQYHQALNEAENQIELLLKIIRAEKLEEVGHDDAYDEELEYCEEYEEDGDEDIRYKLDELKAALFSAMHKKDIKRVSFYINQIHVLESKMEKGAPNV